MGEDQSGRDHPTPPRAGDAPGSPPGRSSVLVCRRWLWGLPLARSPRSPTGVMILLQTTLWGALPDTRWVILPVMVAGGAAIGLTRLMAAGPDLEDQIAEARDPQAVHRREAFWVALGAICAVAFGGAIGPEAGILAVTAQLSSIVSIRLARTAAARRTLAEAGISGALARVLRVACRWAGACRTRRYRPETGVVGGGSRGGSPPSWWWPKR